MLNIKHSHTLEEPWAATIDPDGDPPPNEEDKSNGATDLFTGGKKCLDLNLYYKLSEWNFMVHKKHISEHVLDQKQVIVC